jgi:ABC-2 type transport system permease protein
MRAFRSLFVASAREWRRDPSALLWTVVFPVIIGLAIGLVFSGESRLRFEVGVVNEAGPAGADLLADLEAAEGLEVFTGTRDAEMKAIDDGNRRAVVIIPPEFDAAVAALRDDPRAADPLPVIVFHNPAYDNAPVLLGTIQEAVTASAAELTGVTPLVALQPQSIRYANLRYVDYMLPGVLAMSLMQLGVYGTAPVLVSQRERHVLRRLSAAPLRPVTLLAAQLLLRMLLSLGQVAILVGISAIVYDAPIQAAQLPALAGLALLGAGVFLTLSYVLAGLSRTEEGVINLGGLVNVAFMLLSGLFFPVDTMPGWLRPVVDAIPLTYLADGLRQLMVGEKAVYSMTTIVLVLLAWLVGGAVIALRVFRWEPQA